MHRIEILTDNQTLGQQLESWTKRFCEENGVFPIIELHEDSELFFQGLKDATPTGVIIAMDGVAGLNASEHLRSLCPTCGLIWCSDLDFSLHAYRLRAEYFILGVPSREEIAESLSHWMINGKRNKKNSIGGVL